MNEKISIIMANYNNSKYIEDAIESVLLQGSHDWELVILDDYSSDNSEQLVKKYLSDKRVRFFKNESNLGYIKTLKKMIEIAENDIIGILDSDDVLIEGAIEKVLSVYNNKKNKLIGFVYTQHIICDENLKDVEMGKCSFKNKNDSDIFGTFVEHFKTFRKKYYIKTDGYDENIIFAEDKDLVLKMEEVTKFYFIDKVLYKYRKIPDSHTTDPKKAQMGRVSYELAKYNAYKRRKNTKVVNLSACQMSSRLFDAVPSCIKARDKRFFHVFSFAFKLCPYNVFSYFMLVYRFIKFPFYMAYRRVLNFTIKLKVHDK